MPDRAEEFVFLLARHERLLGAYVMTMVPHPQDADDILQEAKVVMWRSFAKFELGTNFGAWARKVKVFVMTSAAQTTNPLRMETSSLFKRHHSDQRHITERLPARPDCVSSAMSRSSNVSRSVPRSRVTPVYTSRPLAMTLIWSQSERISWAS